MVCRCDNRRESTFRAGKPGFPRRGQELQSNDLRRRTERALERQSESLHYLKLRRYKQERSQIAARSRWWRSCRAAASNGKRSERPEEVQVESNSTAALLRTKAQ